jgi:serine protease Do
VQAPDWIKIGRELKPAVVNVSAKRAETATPEMQGPSGEETPFDRYFKDFFGSRPKRHARSMGSGFIINQNGYIVTNNHVVEGASQVQVKLSDGRELRAKVIGRDSKTDIALLKVEASGLTVIPLGDSSASQVGEPVMAIGNPFGLEQTVTTGIVSATGRAIGAGPYDASSRPMPRSIRATAAGRSSTRAAKPSASTRQSSRRAAGRWVSASPSR